MREIFLKIMLGCLTAIALGGAPALAECNVTRFSFYPGAAVSANMTVSSGRTCGINLRAAGESRFDSVAISVRPTHGTLSAREGGGVTYRAPSGYKGEDSFVFTVTGQMHTGRGTATIRITVNVI